MTLPPPESETPLTDELSTFLVTQFPATLGNLELHRKLTRFEQQERELNAAKEQGQEVHDYLVSVNPDNQYLSVLEAVIQQRSIENTLRQQLTTTIDVVEKQNAVLETGPIVCTCGGKKIEKHEPDCWHFKRDEAMSLYKTLKNAGQRKKE